MSNPIAPSADRACQLRDLYLICAHQYGEYVEFHEPDSVLVLLDTAESVQTFFESVKGTLPGVTFTRQDGNRNSVLIERCMGGNGDVPITKMVDLVKKRFGDKAVNAILVAKYSNPNNRA